MTTPPTSKGAWYANGTTSLVTVDGQEIHLTSDVAYGYALDTGAKTITFTFGDLQGQGRYRFSADRSELVITDGDGFSFWGNLFSDIGWQFGPAPHRVAGQGSPARGGCRRRDGARSHAGPKEPCRRRQARLRPRTPTRPPRTTRRATQATAKLPMANRRRRSCRRGCVGRFR